MTLVLTVIALTGTSVAGARAASPPRGKVDLAEMRVAASSSALVRPSGLELAPLGDQPYSAASPFNEPIAPGAPLAPESAQMVGTLLSAEQNKGFVLTVGRWTVPIYLANEKTPRQTVALRRAPAQWNEPASYRGFPPGWSASLSTPLPEQMQDVPIPAGARPDPSLDAHMTIIDRAEGCEYDLYGASRTATGWQAIWMNSTPIAGTGVYPAGMGTRASGFAGAAGLIWPGELRSGKIDHALLFAYPDTKAGGPVAPATSSDGLSTLAGAIPEGARVQLNPNLDLDGLDLTGYQRVIAEALQRYGMILGDTGGAMGLFAAGRQSFATNPYAGILPSGDFPNLSAIPVDQFRVLASGPQTAKPELQLEENGCGSYD